MNTTLRLAILSDIHGNLAALEAVEQDFLRRGIDAVINLGDSLSGPLLPKETAQFLMAKSDWVQLAGNHERQVLALSSGRPGGESDAYAYSQLSQPELDWIASLQPAQAYSEDVFLCHGTPDSDITHFLISVEDGGMRAATAAEIDTRVGAVPAALIACGHTHLPRCVRSSRGQLIVNPGSVGLQAYDDTHGDYYVVENGSPDARYAIVEQRVGQWTAQLISVPYDFESMAQLARLRQRDEWAYALRTGYMPTA